MSVGEKCNANWYRAENFGWTKPPPDEAWTREASRAYHKASDTADAQFRADIEAEFDVIGHPKAGRLYDIAWSMGHSAGHHEVLLYYADMVDLIR